MIFMLDKLKASDKLDNIWRVKFGSQFCQVQVVKSPWSKSSKKNISSDTCYLILGNYVRSFDELRDVLMVEYHSFIEARQMFVWQLRELFALMSNEDEKNERERARAEMIKRVVDCHLEKLNSSVSENNNDSVNELVLCELCRSERTLKDYVGWLFDIKDGSVKSETGLDLKKLVKLAFMFVSFPKKLLKIRFIF